MSFVPVTGPATFRAAEPPREGVVEFTDERRTVSLPIRAALPVLTKARSRDDLHPSVGLLSGAALLALRLVAAGKFAPAGSSPSWRVAGLDAEDEHRIAMLAGGAEQEQLVRDLLDAVADAMPRSQPRSLPGPAAAVAPRERRPTFEERLQARLARHQRVDARDLPQLVTISLRVEADEEELVAGAVRLVPQAHDEQNPLHLCDLALLWTGTPEEHGFGERARTHATIALRAAADAWPVLDRLLELRVPDQLVLDTDELVSLLDEGVGALRARGVDVLWPRSLGRDLTATTVLDRVPSGPREEPLNEPVLSREALFAFNWQLAVHGDPLTPEEMDQLAASASPLLRLRGAWTVVDPAIVRKARKRL
ncbi:MAG TPA: SNF2 helicase-associated domain-containing protein, partial [Nocardioides sp.]|nr:SNF2 helicase-associated domain-containing protein [Nocardioides sp.]